MTVGIAPMTGPGLVDGGWLDGIAGGANRISKYRLAGSSLGTQQGAAEIPPLVQLVEFDFSDAVGPVASVDVITPGSGYTTATATIAGGDGTAVLTPTVAPIVTGTVLEAPVTEGGTGYTEATATITTSTGSGATLTPVIEGGVITSITVTAPGTGYAAGDTVAITGDGTGATATLAVGDTGGTITGITVTTPGTGYTAADPITIAGDGAGATAEAVISTAAMSAQLPIASEPGTVICVLNASPNELDVFANDAVNHLTNAVDLLNMAANASVVVASHSLAWFACAKAGIWIGK